MQNDAQQTLHAESIAAQDNPCAECGHGFERHRADPSAPGALGIPTCLGCAADQRPPYHDFLASAREPWGPEREPWGDPPLSDETVRRIAQRARYFGRLYGRTSAANARRIVNLLVEDVQLLAADHDAYDVVEAPDGH